MRRAAGTHRDTVVGVFGAGLVAQRSEDFLREAGFAVRRHEGTRVEPSVARAIDIAVTATSSKHQVLLAAQLLGHGVSVVSTADQPSAVRQLCRFERRCVEGQSLVVGAAFAPGLSSLLVGHLAARFDRVDTITTARFGTGGPTCAREHHRSMAAPSLVIDGGQPRWVRGGSGRQLVWFPEPAGAADCYRGGLVEPFLLHRVFPDVHRIQALQAATRRDRLTAQLPMLRRPHAEGRIGALWVEVRGVRNGAYEHRVLAASAPQATGAGAMVSAVVASLHRNEVRSGVSCTAELPRPTEVVRSLPNAVGLRTYDGSIAASNESNAPIRAARKWQKH